jgi:hypothetical protein
MSNKEIGGNIHHNIQPVIGWMRLAIHDDKPLTKAQMEAAVAKLYLALEEANKLL